jgi:hypothetical protein
MVIKEQQNCLQNAPKHIKYISFFSGMTPGTLFWWGGVVWGGKVSRKDGGCWEGTGGDRGNGGGVVHMSLGGMDAAARLNVTPLQALFLRDYNEQKGSIFSVHIGT